MANNIYNGAIAHYAQLKQSMLTRLQQDASIQNITREELANMIVSTSSNQPGLQSRTQQIFSAIENAILNSQDKYSNLVNILQSQGVGIEQQAYQEAKNGLLILLEQNKKEILKSALQGDMLNQISASDYNTVFGQMKSLLVHTLVAKKNITMYQATARRIGGFVGEVAELQALRQFFNSPPFTTGTVMPYLTGSMTNSSGKDTPMDLILNLNQDIQSVETAFNRGMAYSISIDKFLSGVASYDIIDVFGEQVKSYNISDTARFYHIGMRSGLLSGYKNQFADYTDVENAVQYLAETKNTLEALGPLNVIFRTGNSRYWMDDFLRDIIGDMRLIFEPEAKKSVYLPTANVGFTRIYANYKNQKNKLRRKFKK